MTMLNKKDILEYAKECGYESAANILLLLGYSGFDGNITEYDELYEELEAKASATTEMVKQ